MSDDALQTACNLLTFVSQLVQNGEDDARVVDLEPIRTMIDETIPQRLHDYAPPNFAEWHAAFQYEFEKFNDFILFDALIGRNVVALGGAFSCGKSSFLNAMMGQRMLPAGIKPSTSVPTYIVYSAEERAQAVNEYMRKAVLPLEQIKLVSHGFSTEVKKKLSMELDVNFGHILRNIFIETPNQTYEHLAFLDTPGYSKADGDFHSSRTDESIARVQLNSSTFILWFVNAEAGTITEADLQFLQTIDKTIPKLVIVNKCDKKADSDVKDIVEHAKHTLISRGIMFEDVLTFSSKPPLAYDTEKVREYLQTWNQRVCEATFASHFKKLFVQCNEYYRKLGLAEGKRLSKLNRVMTLLDEDSAEVVDTLTVMVKDARVSTQRIRDMETTVKALQLEFFAQLKAIGDEVGIALPEPSEIDLMDGQTSNPLQVIRQYKTNGGLKDQDYFQHLRAALLGIVPKEVFSRLMDALKLHPLSGESDYAKKLYLSALTAIVHHDGDVDHHETGYIMRMAEGFQLGRDISEYLKRSLAMTESFIHDFVHELSDRKTAFYFVLDALLLAACDLRLRDEELELVGEFAELLGVAEDELLYLAEFASCVMEQNSARYLSMPRVQNPRLHPREFLNYLHGFHQGRMYEDEQQVYWTGELLIDGELTISAEEVIIMDAQITLVNGAKLNIIEGRHLLIANSTFRGEHHVEVDSFEKVEWLASTFSEFSVSGAAVITNCPEVLIRGCTFRQCEHTANRNVRYGIRTRGEDNGQSFAELAETHSLDYLTAGGALVIEDCDEGIIEETIFEYCRSVSEMNRNVFASAVYIVHGSDEEDKRFQLNKLNFIDCNNVHRSGGKNHYVDNGQVTLMNYEREQFVKGTFARSGYQGTQGIVSFWD